ncbi:MAG: IS200/IS605 family transposase [Lachnospiraceae bacterium]|nr:IS200/IS605 family transposase [Lachnospiraceae bacterium]
MRKYHVRFRERFGVKLPLSTRPRYKCQYHIVFIPKYRKRILYGKIKADVRDIIKRLCDYRKIEIVEGAVCADHVHLCLSIPPSEKVCDVVAYIKGKSALMIHDRYPETVNGWSKSFWARGYYVATVGNITEEAVKKYIQEQKEESKREDTR